MEHIKRNIEEIQKKLNNDVTLVAVTKYRSIPEIQAVYDAGIRDMGENRVQEFRDKEQELPKDIRWHIIGRLQKNKLKYIIGKVHLIHSVDSLSLAEAIDAFSEKVGTVTDILLQVNVSGEEAKQGIEPDQLEGIIESLSGLSHIRIRGLMTMAPNIKNIPLLSDIFAQTKELYDKMKGNENEYSNVTMDYLSMGMTNDYTIAVENGSNMVRVGSGIFKEEEA